MKPRIHLSVKAALDFEAIIEYYHASTPATARTFYNSIRKAIRQLSRFPHLGRIVPEFAEDYLDLYRELIHKHYRVIYRLGSDEIIITRIIDGRRLLTLDFFEHTQQ